jgi:hypothetical protein
MHNLYQNFLINILVDIDIQKHIFEININNINSKVNETNSYSFRQDNYIL